MRITGLSSILDITHVSITTIFNKYMVRHASTLKFSMFILYFLAREALAFGRATTPAPRSVGHSRTTHALPSEYWKHFER